MGCAAAELQPTVSGRMAGHLRLLRHLAFPAWKSCEPGLLPQRMEGGRLRRIVGVLVSFIAFPAAGLELWVSWFRADLIRNQPAR
jgi:hypothetical protein